jgi:hypothetical protein
MATALAKAKQFSEQTEGLTRAQQLKWFIDHLGLGEPQVLALIGYSPAEIQKRDKGGIPFEKLAEAKPEETLWVSELFLELVHRAGYDMDRLLARLKQAAFPSDDRPKANGAATSVPELLREIRAGGPDVFSNLTDYLRLPQPVRGRKATKSKKPA